MTPVSVFLSVLFFTLLGMAYVKGYDAVKRRSPGTVLPDNGHDTHGARRNRCGTLRCFYNRQRKGHRVCRYVYNNVRDNDGGDACDETLSTNCN